MLLAMECISKYIVIYIYSVLEMRCVCCES